MKNIALLPNYLWVLKYWKGYRAAFISLEQIASSKIETLMNIEGSEEEIAVEILNRAINYANIMNEQILSKLKVGCRITINRYIGIIGRIYIEISRVWHRRFRWIKS